LFGLAMLLGLTVVVTVNIPESIYAQMSMSAPSAGEGPQWKYDNSINKN
jgi:hypothetical protein